MSSGLCEQIARNCRRSRCFEFVGYVLHGRRDNMAARVIKVPLKGSVMVSNGCRYSITVYSW